MLPTTWTDPRAQLFGWAGAFGVLTFQVARGHVVGLDHAMAAWVAGWRTPHADGWMTLLAFPGDAAVTWAALALGAVWARSRKRWAPFGFFSGALIVGMVVQMSMRLTVPQWRPDASEIPMTMHAIQRFHLAGFPSGHAFRSAFLGGWVLQHLPPLSSAIRRFLVGLVILLIIGVGVTRVALNRHWASDVLGGWLLAWVALSVSRCWAVGFSRRPA